MEEMTWKLVKREQDFHWLLLLLQINDAWNLQLVVLGLLQLLSPDKGLQLQAIIVHLKGTPGIY
jgi:hypothetical protein